MAILSEKRLRDDFGSILLARNRRASANLTSKNFRNRRSRATWTSFLRELCDKLCFFGGGSPFYSIPISPSLITAWSGAKLVPMLLCSWLPLPQSCMEKAKTSSILTQLLSCSTSWSIYRQEHASTYMYVYIFTTPQTSFLSDSFLSESFLSE